MIHKIVSLYDAKAQVFSQPHFVQSTGAAIRSLQQLINSPEKKSDVAQFPGDFTLFELGEWNDATAEWTIHKGPMELAKCLSLVDDPREQPLPLEAVSDNEAADAA